MEKWNSIRLLGVLLISACFGLSPSPLSAAEESAPPAPAESAAVVPTLPNTVTPAPTTNSAPAAAPASRPEPSPESIEALRAYLRLQEQLHTALLAVEQARAEGSTQARTNTEALVSRLESLERALAQQREQNLLVAQSSNRMMVFMAAGILVIGVLALAFTAVFQARGMNRLAEIATGLSADRTLPGIGPGGYQLGPGEPFLISSPGGAHGSNGSGLRSTIERLEGRIREMEASAHGDSSMAPPARPSAPPARPGNTDSVLMAKGLSLASVGQLEGALACYDEVIAKDPDNADAYLRKGAVLERLNRLSAAIECYDRAIALDGTLAQAYLGKGGILNRQEKYREALECYEQALRSGSRA